MRVGRPPTAKTVKDYFSSGSARKLWKEGSVEKENLGNGFGEFDDGKYRAKLVKAFTAMSNTSGRPQNVFAFKFLDGEYKGQTVYQYQGLDNKIGIALALVTLSKLGHDVNSPDDIDLADKQLQKEQPVCEIRLRTKGEFQNVIVTAVNQDSDEDAEEEEDQDVDVEEAKTKKSPVKEEVSDDADDSDDADSDEDADEDSEDDEDEPEEDADESVKKTKKASKDKPKVAEKEEDDDEDDEDEEAEEADEDEVALEVGMKLKIKYDGATVRARIVKVNEDDREVRVKLAEGNKVTISVDDIIDVIS